MLNRLTARSNAGTIAAAVKLSHSPDAFVIPSNGTANAPISPENRQSGRLSSPAFPRVATERTSQGTNAQISQPATRKPRNIDVKSTGSALADDAGDVEEGDDENHRHQQREPGEVHQRLLLRSDPPAAAQNLDQYNEHPPAIEHRDR